MIVSAGIAGLALVALNISKMTAKSGAKYEASSDITLMTNEINATLSDSAKCYATFKTNTLTPSSINGRYYTETSGLGSATGYGNSGIKIQSYQLALSTATGATANDGVLTILFKNKQIVGVPTSSKRVYIYFEGPISAITNCRSLASASVDIWSHALGNDIFYSGKVGIGLNQPTTSLEVGGAGKFYGVIESTSGGVKFPNGTTQTSAIIPGNCLVGQLVTGINSNNGTIICSALPQSNAKCPTGNYVSGFDASGGVICSALPLAVAPSPVACAGVWSACSASCGGGLMTFQVIVPSSNGGAACPSSPQSCNTQACPVNCAGYWSACSAACGGGTQNYIVTTASANGGLACPSPSTLSCNTGSCGCTSCVCDGGFGQN